jgi:hypothetical protein
MLELSFKSHHFFPFLITRSFYLFNRAQLMLDFLPLNLKLGQLLVICYSQKYPIIWRCLRIYILFAYRIFHLMDRRITILIFWKGLSLQWIYVVLDRFIILFSRSLSLKSLAYILSRGGQKISSSLLITILYFDWL